MFKIGITEVMGEPGVGKTNFILSQIKQENTLYITNRNVPSQIGCLKLLWILRVNTFFEFRIFMTKQLSYLINLYSFKCIVVDSFDAFLYTENKPREKRKDVTNIIQCMRNIIFKHKSKVIIVNNLFNNKDIFDSNFLLYNKYFGYKWLYYANKKFIIRKKLCGNRVIYSSSSEFLKTFKITGFAQITFVSNKNIEK